MRQELKHVLLEQARTLAPEELPRLLGDLEEVRTKGLSCTNLSQLLFVRGVSQFGVLALGFLFLKKCVLVSSLLYLSKCEDSGHLRALL